MSLTSANSTLLLSVPNVYDIAQIVEGFDVDDAFATDGIEIGEDKVGVDGRYSFGFVFSLIPIKVTLQADSPSVQLFTEIFNAEQSLKDKLPVNLTIEVPSIHRSYVFTNGIVKNWPPFATARKILQPVTFGLSFASSNITVLPL